MAVALGSDQFHPSVAFELLLETQGVPNLDKLQLNDFIVLITVGVDVRKNLKARLGSAFCNMPSNKGKLQ